MKAIYRAVLAAAAVFGTVAGLENDGPVAASQSARQACPVAIDHVDMSYNHAGGQSTPQLRLGFTNRTRKDLAGITFQLMTLDSSGAPQPYPRDFEYTDALEAGKSKSFSWDLEAGSVDIHRTGETVTLVKAAFADGSSWSDDGSESCALTVDYHPR